MANVVDGFENDDVLHARLRDHVAVEAGERAGAGVVMQDAVAANALVKHADVGGLWVGEQAAGEFVGPACVLVYGGEGSVGNAVAERDDGGRLGGHFDVNAFQEDPAAEFGGTVQRLGADDVARRRITGLVRSAVLREMMDGLRRKEKTDGQVRARLARYCETGSLTASAPGGMMTPVRPPNVRPEEETTD